MSTFQLQLESLLASVPQVDTLMMLRWSWPIVESVHFIGLTLLLGAIGAWDLRLLGVLRGGSVNAFHRLVPVAVLGFALNAASGVLFLITYPDQYVFNAAFHVKMLFLVLAGLNVALFYLVTLPRLDVEGADVPPSFWARLHGGVSLALWIAVIIAGRMITFFRPALCDPSVAIGWLADCYPG